MELQHNQLNHNLNSEHLRAKELKQSVVPSSRSEELGLLLINTRQMMLQRDYKIAEQLLMKIFKIDSSHLMALEWVYEIQWHKQAFENCMMIAKNILKLKNDFRACVRLATLHYKLGQDQQALDRYFESLAVLSADSEMLFEIYKNIGNIYTRFEDFDAAEEYYNKAYTLDPDSDVLHVNFGTLALQKNEFEKAKQCFHFAIRMNQSNSQAWTGLAMMYHQQADFDLAWATLRQGFDFDHQNKTALQLICQWALTMNKSQEAIHCCLQYLDQNDFDQDVSGWLVEQFMASQKFGSALLEVEKLKSFCPELTQQLSQIIQHLEEQCSQRAQWI